MMSVDQIGDLPGGDAAVKLAEARRARMYRDGREIVDLAQIVADCTVKGRVDLARAEGKLRRIAAIVQGYREGEE